ncbi:hypothetical protein EIN_277950 [Entamoeba invadens IP1]|uniref:Serine aminopeptidase S33 domain-containing protein n=1 Tax=Entamoeba invadens IP1 TaxID=370355 RepID=A0A0A1TXR1_ENTIV|nr:hypothetical protein EIN_277950 [Entamoeba invadens IP1]ELP84345.1 hypothetical protein EIN_277950 [Entamoeba invadens IP1]|eukprot:XP_004183691.1 hypothetical protein EIN_277950 [Entamoeba invadens IP1]
MSNLKFIEKTYDIDTFTIFSREYINPSQIAVLYFIHGFTEYGGFYHEVAEYFYRHKFSVFLVDLPGHGKSSCMKEGGPTYIDTFERYINVLNTYFIVTKMNSNIVKNCFKSEREMMCDTSDNQRKNEEKEIPQFLFGHSMGGLLTSILASRNSGFKGYITAAPAYIINNFATKYLSWPIEFGLVMSPYFKIGNNGAKNAFNHIKNAIRFGKDELIAKEFSVHTCIEMKRYGFDEQIRETEVPFLIFQGKNDKIVDVEGARMKSRHIKNKHSRYIEYPEQNHMLLDEDKKTDIFQTAMEWCLELMK